MGETKQKHSLPEGKHLISVLPEIPLAFLPHLERDSPPRRATTSRPDKKRSRGTASSATQECGRRKPFHTNAEELFLLEVKTSQSGWIPLSSKSPTQDSESLVPRKTYNQFSNFTIYGSAYLWLKGVLCIHACMWTLIVELVVVSMGK
jgi:hypothetical protein